MRGGAEIVTRALDGGVFDLEDKTRCVRRLRRVPRAISRCLCHPTRALTFGDEGELYATKFRMNSEANVLQYKITRGPDDRHDINN